MKEPHKKLYEIARDDIPAKIAAFERKLHDAGLHRSARALNEAADKIGWEIAEKLEEMQKS